MRTPIRNYLMRHKSVPFQILSRPHTKTRTNTHTHAHTCIRKFIRRNRNYNVKIIMHIAEKLLISSIS